MARKKMEAGLAEMVSGWGFAFEVLQKLAVAVTELGGNLDHVRRILREPALVVMIAQLLVGTATGQPLADLPADHYRVFVNYVLPPMVTLKALFNYVSDMWDGRPWTLHGSVKNVTQTPGELVFFLRSFGTKMTSEDVVTWAAATGYRVATHLEALAFAQAHPDILRTRLYVALGSVVHSDVRMYFYLAPSAGVDHRGLNGFTGVGGWRHDVYFLLVRK
jgi:hypothetical protein